MEVRAGTREIRNTLGALCRFHWQPLGEISMDEQRMQPYVGLIEQLLGCPQGEEAALLQAHGELVDAGLLAVMGSLHQIEQWAGLKTIVMVRRVRHLWNKTTREVMFYLTFLPWDAALIGRAIRTYCGIENQLHWVLDVTWGEDKSRIRQGHGGENMALLLRLDISALNQETSKKRSLNQKAKRAAIDPDYMLSVLAAGLAT